MVCPSVLIGPLPHCSLLCWRRHPHITHTFWVSLHLQASWILPQNFLELTTWYSPSRNIRCHILIAPPPKIPFFLLDQVFQDLSDKMVGFHQDLVTMRVWSQFPCHNDICWHQLLNDSVPRRLLTICLRNTQVSLPFQFLGRGLSSSPVQWLRGRVTMTTSLSGESDQGAMYGNSWLWWKPPRTRGSF